MHYVETLTKGEIIRRFNGSIEFEWLKVRFSPIIARYIEHRHKKSHQPARARPDNNDDSGLALEKLLSSINQTDTFTQSQSIYFIRFQLFATSKNEKLPTEILR